MRQPVDKSLPATLRTSRSGSGSQINTLLGRLQAGRVPKAGSLADATRSLAVLVGAGINLHDALRSIAHHADDERVQEIFENVAVSVRNGRNLSDALSSHPRVFSRLYVQLVRVGEEGGILADVLARLADYLEASHTIRRRIRSAMAYPVLILVVALAATAFLLVVIVPTFAEMYRDYDATLPGPTNMLLDASSLLTDHWLLVLVTCCVAVISAVRLARIPRIQGVLHRGILRVPVVGPYVRFSVSARLSRNLGTLLANRVPLDDSLRMLKRTIDFVPLGDTIDDLLRAVTRGRTISSRLSDNALFSGVAAQMIAAGEESGELDRMLLHVAEHQENELERRTDSLLSLMEPVIILVIGAVLGGILVALYLPLFELSQVVG